MQPDNAYGVAYNFVFGHDVNHMPMTTPQFKFITKVAEQIRQRKGIPLPSDVPQTKH